MAELNNLFNAASQEMYAAAQQAQAQGGATADNGAGAGAGKDQEVTDVDFEEVKDEKK